MMCFCPVENYSEIFLGFLMGTLPEHLQSYFSDCRHLNIYDKNTSTLILTLEETSVL